MKLERKENSIEICWTANLHRTRPLPASFQHIQGTDGVPGVESNAATSPRAEQERP